MDFYASKCPIITDSESDRYTYMGVCLSHPRPPSVHLPSSCFTQYSFAPRHIPEKSGKQSESGQHITVTMKKISIRTYLDDIHPDGDYSHKQTRPSVKSQGLLYSLNLFRTFLVATLIASGTLHVAFYLKVELYLRFSS